MLLKGAYCVGEHFVDPQSCLILIYTACGFCVHASCHETAKGLAIFSSL